ncbi:MAG: hypothetical protein Q7T85_06590, partial [Nitrosomonas sp.]|nr:hypothetical protein [Nitrosomonas sp.]
MIGAPALPTFPNVIVLETAYVPPRRNTTEPLLALLITVHMLQGEASEQVVPLPVGDANRVPFASAVAT